MFNNGTRIVTQGGVLLEETRADGIDAQQGPIATISLMESGTQVYDIWHGPLMLMFINGTQTIDDRGYP